MSNSGGVSSAGVLGVVFITLKLTGVIDWSWWMVTLPLWIGLPIVAVVMLVGVVVVLVKDKIGAK